MYMCSSVSSKKFGGFDCECLCVVSVHMRTRGQSRARVCTIHVYVCTQACIFGV